MNDPTRLVGEVAAILSIGAGVIHYSAAGDHTNLPVMFAGFVVVASLQVALGALLLLRRQPSEKLVLAGIALMLGSIGAWLLSRTAGLPFLEDGHAEPIGFKDGVTVLFELASIPPLLLLLSRDLARVTLPSPRLEAQTLTALGATCLALMVPALVLDGGGHHSHEEAVELGIHDDDHGAGDAHADRSSHDDPNGAHHATKADGKSADGHGHGAAKRSSGHHSGVELASTPLGTSHEHGGDSEGGDAPEHHADDEGEGNHRGGDHRRDRPDRDRGHGDHENEEPGDGSGDEPPVSLSYDPEPSVCITTVCVP